MGPAIGMVILAALAAADPPQAPVGARAGSPALASLEAEQSSLFSAVAPSVVLLVRDGVSGSGFVVGEEGLVLTNAHVVGDAPEVAVQLLDGRHGRGRVVARATGNLDLALVEIPFHDVPPLAPAAPDEARAGTFAATVGHGGGAAWTFSTGLVANPSPVGSGAPLLLAQMALRPGSSGGPLVDRLGRVLAIVTAGTRDASGVTFAIRLDAAMNAFPRLAAAHATAAGSPGLALAGTGAASAPDPAVDAAARPKPADVAVLAQERAAPAMITVWEARRVWRRTPSSPPATRPARSLAQARAAPARSHLAEAAVLRLVPLAAATLAAASLLFAAP